MIKSVMIHFIIKSSAMIRLKDTGNTERNARRRCPILLRYPDKPNEVHKSNLLTFDAEPGIWQATQKVDGWRTFVTKDSKHKISNKSWATGKHNDLFFVSRRGIKTGGPTKIPVNDQIIDTVDSLDLPDQSMLDCEWMARRTIGELPEKLFGLDILWYNDEWYGKKPAKERDAFFRPLIKVNDVVGLPDLVDRDYSKFFEIQTEIPWTEGIVLKHHTCTIIGDNLECKKNSLIIKIKWRSGPDGRETFNL